MKNDRILLIIAGLSVFFLGYGPAFFPDSLNTLFFKIIHYVKLAMWAVNVLLAIRYAKLTDRSPVGWGIGAFFVPFISNVILALLPVTKKTVTETKINRGTYFDSFTGSTGYWMSRLAKPDNEREPFVYYCFPTKSEARQALLALPYIHVDNNTGNLICEEVFNFGYYRGQNNGQPTDEYHAFVAGAGLTVQMWQELHDVFQKYGGRKNDDRKPAENVKSVSNKGGNTNSVVFVRKEFANGATYLTYRAPSKADALAFLSEQTITQSAYFKVVETPEGNFGKDILGIYTE